VFPRMGVAFVVALMMATPTLGSTQKEVIAEYYGKEISPSQLVVTMERGTCFGSCPSYRVTIHGTGEVEYEGLNCVVTLGVERGTVSRELALDLVNDLLRAHFFDAPSEYVVLDQIRNSDGRLEVGGPYVSDGPSTYLQLRLGRHENRVRLYNHYPDDLKAITEKIDGAVNIEQWIGSYCERRLMPNACPGPEAPECRASPNPPARDD
jgi:Domain of unknown function (DUF6438)